MKKFGLPPYLAERRNERRKNSKKVKRKEFKLFYEISAFKRL